ncbi:hypothetical protein L6Q79_12880 [bacterium]|nr:hypothetical protein [bacterium]NUN46377.1 hypothetical protein [bacterium]
MSLLHFLRAAFFSAVFSSAAFAGDFGELIVHLRTPQGDPFRHALIELLQTPYASQSNEEGVVHFYLLPTGVYELKITTETLTVDEPFEVFVGRYPATSIEIVLDETQASLASQTMQLSSTVQNAFPYTVRLQTSRSQNKLTGRHAEGFLLNMPGAIYTSRTPREDFESTEIAARINVVNPLQTYRDYIHVRSNIDEALGFRVNGQWINDLFDGQKHLQVPHRAIMSVLLQEGAADIRSGNFSQVADIQTKQGSDRLTFGGSFRSDKPVAWLGGTSYGYRQFDGEISGAIIPKKLYFYSAAEYENTDDNDPSVVGVPDYKIKHGSGGKDTVIWKSSQYGPRPGRSNARKTINAYTRFTVPLTRNIIFDVSGLYSHYARNWFTMPQLLSPEGAPRTENTAFAIQSSATWHINEQWQVSGKTQYISTHKKNADRRLFKSTSYALNNIENLIIGSTGHRIYFNDNLFYDIGATGHAMFEQNESTVHTESITANYRATESLSIESGISRTAGTYRSAMIYDYENPINGANDIYGYTVTTNFDLKEKNSGKDGAKQPVIWDAYSEATFKNHKLTASFGFAYRRIQFGTDQIKDYHYPAGHDQIITDDDYKKTESTYYKILPRIGITADVSEGIVVFSHYGWYYFADQIKYRYHSTSFLERQSLAPPFATILGNSTLQPSKVGTFDIGGRMQINSDFNVGGSWYRQKTKDRINQSSIVSFPNSLMMYGAVSNFNTTGFILDASLEVQDHITLIGYSGVQEAEESYFYNAGGFRAAWLGFSSPSSPAKLKQSANHEKEWHMGGMGTIHFDDTAPVWWLKHSYGSLRVTKKDGALYTPTTVAPIVVLGIPSSHSTAKQNSRRSDDMFTIDLKLGKSFHYRKFQAIIFLECTNLFNTQNPVSVFTATGKPDDNGFLQTTEFYSYSSDQQNRRRPQYKAHFRNGLMYEPGRELLIGLEVTY